MAIQTGDYIRITAHGYALEQEIEFVCHLRCTGNEDMQPTLGNLSGLLNALTGNSVEAYAWFDDYLACLPTGYKSDRVSAQIIFPDNRKTVRVDYPWAKTGTGGAGPSASNLAVSMCCTANGVGRQYLAKYHIGPIPDARYAAGEITATQQTKINDLALLLCTNPNTLTTGGGGESGAYEWVVYHRNAAPASLHGHTLILPRYNATVRSQRRRTVGLGS